MTELQKAIHSLTPEQAQAVLDRFEADANRKATTMTNETKHTPGPWHVHSNDPEDQHFRVRSVIPGGKFKIANCPYTPHSTYEVEAEANARLIATAPELLEALKALVDGINDEWTPAFSEPLLSDGDIALLEQARHAIAKAEKVTD